MNFSATSIYNTFGPITIYSHPLLAALFRVKLRREYIGFKYAGTVNYAEIICLRKDYRLIVGSDEVRVDEIHEFFVVESFQRRSTPLAILRLFNLIPSYLRNFHEPSFRILGRKFGDFTVDDIKAFMFAELFALRKKQLHAETNTHERFSGRYEFLYRPYKIEFLEVMHGVAESPDSWEDGGIAFQQFVLLRSDFNLKPQMFACVFHAEQIADLIVYNRNQTENRLKNRPQSIAYGE